MVANHREDTQGGSFMWSFMWSAATRRRFFGFADLSAKQSRVNHFTANNPPPHLDNDKSLGNAMTSHCTPKPSLLLPFAVVFANFSAR
jgi:hypothetical protein